MQKRSNFNFDLSEVKEVKIWPPRGQNGKSMLFLKSLTQKTYILIYMMQKRSNFSFDLLEVKEVKMTSGRSNLLESSLINLLRSSKA